MNFTKVVGRLVGMVLAASVLMFHLSTNASAAGTGGLPDGAVAMSVGDVVRLYSDRTWKWGEGGGYFSPDRTFQAVTGSRKNRTVAAGRWAVTKEGAMCMIADWRTRKSVSKNQKTCFLHARAGKMLFQKKTTGDQWYVFRNSPIQKADEYLKLTSGNLIAESYIAALTELGR